MAAPVLSAGLSYARLVYQWTWNYQAYEVVPFQPDSSVLYVKLTNTRLAGAYQAMLDFATRCRRAGMNVTLTAIDGLPEVDIPACERIAKELGVAFRRRTLGAVG